MTRRTALTLKKLLTIRAASASVIVAAVTAIVSNIVQYECTVKQVDQATLTQNVDVILRLDEQFYERLLKKREKVAKEYLKNPETADYADLLDFFDGVDTELVWNSYYFYFTRYYQISENYIKAQRKLEGDPTLWENVDYLNVALTKFEQQKHGQQRLKPLTKAQLRRFMQSESEP